MLSISSLAQESPRQAISQEERSQLNRQQALEEKLSPEADDVRLLSKESGSSTLDYPVETPCFRFQKIELLESALFDTIDFNDIVNQSLNVCLGGQGINLLMSTLQNRLIEQGYVTTRVLASTQDLTDGQFFTDR